MDNSCSPFIRTELTFDLLNISSYLERETLGTTPEGYFLMYRKVSNIRGTQNKKLTDSRLIMQLPLPNALKPGVKSRMKM